MSVTLRSERSDGAPVGWVPNGGQSLLRRITAFLTDGPAARGAIIVSAVVVACIWLWGGFFVWLVGYAEEMQTRTLASRTNVMASAYVSQTLKSGEIVINSMAAMVAEQRIDSDARLRTYLADAGIHRILRDRIANMQDIDKAAFIAANGDVVNFSLTYPPPPINVADRDYFRAQMQPAAPSVSLSTVVLDRGSGKWTFYLARRITAPDGRVLGLAIAGIKAGFLADFLKPADIGPDSAIYLQRDDGVVLTGTGIKQSAFGQAFAAAPPTAEARLMSTASMVPTLFDSSRHIVSTVAVDGAPARLVVVLGARGLSPGAVKWTAIIIAVAASLSIGIALALRRVLRLVSALAVARDQAQAASRAKTQFLTTMSHELRTPMNGILGMIELSLEVPPGPQQTRFIRTAHQSGIFLRDLIAGVLEFARIESGRMVIERRPVDLAAIIAEVVAMLGAEAAAKQLTVRALPVENVPAPQEGDPLRLRQVITNLVANAIKFTEAGEVTVGLTRPDPDGDPALLRVEVRDTGIGIPAAKRADIFEPFVQADSTITRRFGGTGLGLTISRDIIRAMGGDIGVESTPGVGSVFWFALHLAPMYVPVPRKAPADGRA